MAEKVAEDYEVFVLWRIVAEPDHIEAVRKAYHRPLSSELREAGCSRYECHQDLGDANALLALGVWDSKAQFDQHLLAVRESLESINSLLLS